jgi:glycosyltransferase involved in cell wall biosynthesis
LIATTVDAIGISNNVGDQVSDDVYQQRKISCFGDVEKNIQPCSRLKYIENKGHFCGGCGCGSNNLARLDADSPNEYTKLHYPQLECPLKKRGFSNEEKVEIIELSTEKEFPLSIIITALNESPDKLNQTIKSIRDTSGQLPEIIIVDDCSDSPVKTNEKLIRNSQRMGVAGSRQIGAEAASNDYFLFTDSHMIFENNWFENVKKYIDPTNDTVAYCGSCLGLNDEIDKLENHRGAYYGAKLVLYDEPRKTIFEGKWTGEIKNKDNYEISCMMGALYLIPRKLYFRVRGFSDLKMWGSSEPCISTKIWLSGAEIRLLKTVKAGHFFRKSAPYSTDVSWLIYNKIRLAKTLLPKKLGDELISKLPKDRNFLAACKLIEKDKDEIEDYYRYYQSIFTRDIYWINDKFDICMPK